MVRAGGFAACLSVFDVGLDFSLGIVVCLTMKSLQMWITMFRLHTASLSTGDKVD